MLGAQTLKGKTWTCLPRQFGLNWRSRRLGGDSPPPKLRAPETEYPLDNVPEVRDIYSQMLT